MLFAFFVISFDGPWRPEFVSVNAPVSSPCKHASICSDVLDEIFVENLFQLGMVAFNACVYCATGRLLLPGVRVFR